MAQSPSWTDFSGANPMGLSPQRYTGNPPIPTSIYISGHTIPLGKDTLVSTEKDKDKEKLHIRTALQKCGYPKWIFEKVKLDQGNKKLRAKKTNKKSASDQSDGGLVVIPYVGRLSEATERIFRKYRISTAVKPYKTLRNLLVHPKDKRTIGQTGECVYKIPCHNCNSAYIGETGRSYAKRQEQHRKEVESISNRTLNGQIGKIWQQKRTSQP